MATAGSLSVDALIVLVSAIAAWCPGVPWCGPSVRWSSPGIKPPNWSSIALASCAIFRMCSGISLMCKTFPFPETRVLAEASTPVDPASLARRLFFLVHDQHRRVPAAAEAEAIVLQQVDHFRAGQALRVSAEDLQHRFALRMTFGQHREQLGHRHDVPAIGPAPVIMRLVVAGLCVPRVREQTGAWNEQALRHLNDVLGGIVE